MNENNSWTYEQVQPILETHKALLEAAEIHGLQCGLYIKQPHTAHPRLIKQVAEEASCDLSPQVEALLEGLFTQIKAQLAHLECDFQLLLPKGRALDKRMHALSRWCHGFLYGLKLAGLKETELAIGLSGEAFQDLMLIAAWNSRTHNDESDERAFFDLVEFVRMAAQTLYIELNAEQLPNGDTPAPHTWH